MPADWREAIVKASDRSRSALFPLIATEIAMVCSLLLTPHIAPAKKRSPVILLTVYCAEFRAPCVRARQQILVAVLNARRRFPLNPRCSCVLGYNPLMPQIMRRPLRNQPYGLFSLG